MKFERAVRARDAAAGEGMESMERLREEVARWPGVAVRLDSHVRALGEFGDKLAFEPLRELLEVRRVYDLTDLEAEGREGLEEDQQCSGGRLPPPTARRPSWPARDRLEMTPVGTSEPWVRYYA
jgi:hypothetical protein